MLAHVIWCQGYRVPEVARSSLAARFVSRSLGWGLKYATWLRRRRRHCPFARSLEHYCKLVSHLLARYTGFANTPMSSCSSHQQPYGPLFLATVHNISWRHRTTSRAIRVTKTLPENGATFRLVQNRLRAISVSGFTPSLSHSLVVLAIRMNFPRPLSPCALLHLHNIPTKIHHVTLCINILKKLDFKTLKIDKTKSSSELMINITQHTVSKVYIKNSLKMSF